MTSYVIFIAESPSSWDGCIPAKTSHHFGTSWRKAPPSPRFGSITGGFTWIEARDAFDEISIIYGGGKVGRMLFGEWEMTWMDYMIDRCFVHVIGILLHAWSCVRKSDRITVHEKTTYIYTHIHTYTHTCMHTYMHAYMHTCIHAYMHTCMHAYIHTYRHTHIHTYMHACIHTNMHACIHTYLHACMHPSIHPSIHPYIHTSIHIHIHIHISISISIYKYKYIYIYKCIYIYICICIYIYISWLQHSIYCSRGIAIKLYNIWHPSFF